MADRDLEGGQLQKGATRTVPRPRRKSPNNYDKDKGHSYKQNDEYSKPQNHDSGRDRNRPRYRREDSDRRRRKEYGHSRSRSPMDQEYIRSRRYSDHRPYRSPDPRTFKRSYRSRSRSHSPSRRQRRRSPSQSQSPSPPPRRSSPTSSRRRSNAPLPSQEDAFNNDLAVIKSPPAVEKQKPNYATSGKLAAETNTVAGTGVILKYNEPPEARKAPASQDWRLYVFKGKETLETVELGSRSCWLFGRERAVVDFPTDHPSCSKQHAVLQFRYTERKNEYGDKIGGVKPYVIDLESANGTKLNGEKIPERRFVEVRSGDVLGFGDSSREYVVMLPPAG